MARACGQLEHVGDAAAGKTAVSGDLVAQGAHLARERACASGRDGDLRRTLACVILKPLE